MWQGICPHSLAVSRVQRIILNLIRQGETHDMQEGMEIERIARLLKVSEDDVRNWIEENRLLVK